MAKNAIYILEDEKRLHDFKENAYNYAQKFDIDKILPKYEAMYRKVIKNCC